MPSSSWKTDPLIVAVLSEVRALWDDLEGPDRPQLLRVEHRVAPEWGPVASGPLRNIWVFDKFGPRLAPILRREEHDFGPVRGDFSRFGLVQFAVCQGRTELVFDYHLGPAIAGEIHYGIEYDGVEVRLLAESGTLTL